jgi:hypothetical protein
MIFRRRTIVWSFTEVCGDDRDHLVNPLVYFDLDDNTTIQIVPSDKF